MTNGQKLEELKSIARTRALTDHELRQLLEFYVAASSEYGPRPRAAAKSVVRVKYTCPRCGETAVVSPTYEESAH